MFNMKFNMNTLIRSFLKFVAFYMLLLLLIFIYRTGLIGSKFNHNSRNGACVSIKEIEHGSEDIEISKEGFAFITSGLEHVSRFSKNVDFKKQRGAIYFMDLNNKNRTVIKLKIIGSIDLEEFTPHGLTLWQEGGNTFVFVVNHLLGAVEKVEKFLFDKKTMSLKLLKHYDSAFFYNLNDIAATGPDSFYFVNFNYFLRMGVPEVFLNINKGSVGHHSGSTSKLLLENLSSPNGVLVSPNRKFLHVTTTIKGEFNTYSFDQNEHSLTLIESQILNLYLDNIGQVISLTFDASNSYSLLLGGHTSLWNTIQYLNYPHDAPSGSTVLRLDIDKESGLMSVDNVVSVFTDDGDRFSGCSVATSYGNTMLIGSVHTRMFTCDHMTHHAL